MFILYDLIFLICAIIQLPRYIFRRKFHPGFLLRLGVLPKELNLDNPIWIHAVSVGEAIVIRGLLEKLRQAYPNKKFVISTVTATGNKIVRGIAKDDDFVTYLPLDFGFIVRGVIDKIKPSLFIIAETEIWPNLISYLYLKRVPIVVVNGRISDRSFKGYLAIKFLFRPILNKVNLFCTQAKVDAERLISLGARENSVKVTGNMKFDITGYAESKLKLDLGPKAKLLVAGSTHPGEEEVILDVYKKLLTEFPDLKLVIAPRHPERSSEITNLIKRFGFEPIRISYLNSRTQEPANSRTVFILDTVGQLLSLYALADIVFIGGSLVKIGGHNILEPAVLGKPIIFGPYMFNFRDITELFLRAEAAIQIDSQEQLVEKLNYLLNDAAKADELGRSAKELILKNQGATERNLEYLKSYL